MCPAGRGANYAPAHASGRYHRQVRHRERPRRGRDGPRLRGARSRARSKGRAQARAPHAGRDGRGPKRGHRPPLPRGPRRRQARPPQRRHDLRHGGDRGSPLPRDGAREGPHAAGGRGRSFGVDRAAPLLAPRRRARPRGGPPRGHLAPRRQARERDGPRGRRREGPRFRDRAPRALGRRSSRPHGDSRAPDAHERGSLHRDSPLHGAGADLRRRAHRTDGPVRLGRDGARGVDGGSALEDEERRARPRGRDPHAAGPRRPPRGPRCLHGGRGGDRKVPVEVPVGQVFDDGRRRRRPRREGLAERGSCGVLTRRGCRAIRPERGEGGRGGFGARGPHNGGAPLLRRRDPGDRCAGVAEAGR